MLRTQLAVPALLCIALAATFTFESYAQETTTRNVKAVYSPADGIGPEKGVMRRDPSDIIKVDGLYYVWYSKGQISPGYDATVWYATSTDGRKWTEKGMALAKGKPGTWEGASVFTPNILVAEGRYWLFYTGTSKKYGRLFNPDSKIGIAVSDSPDGPWERLATNPALKNSENPKDFDSHLVDDACLIKRDGKYWFYYKGRQLGKSPAQTKLGLAIADKPQGPYIKHKENPVIPGNHEVLVWPQGKGVAALIGKVGPKDITHSIFYAEDGLHFSKTHQVANVPTAGGAYRPEAFTESGAGKLITWGVHIGKEKQSLPFIQRFDVKELETSSKPSQTKPNIVFIMADDLGPGWVDYDDSNPEVNTPNLERLAKSGMVFTRAYAAASVCSPTRAACITGMSPAQIGMTTHIPGKAGNERRGPKGGPRDAPSLKHLPLELPSYARELKKQGYVTGFLGKWHLAGEGSVGTNDGIVNSDYHPEHYGFDSNIGGCALGQPKSWFDPYRNGTIKNREKGEYLTDRLGDEAASFIRANKDEPFHLTLWPYSVHTPIRAPRDLVKKNGGNNYRAMLESLDNAVGKVLDALKTTGTLDNTMVVFYSDNGGHIRTEWLADKKASLLEGGLRVPLVVSWPGVIKGGTKCDVPVTSMDFFPTFVHAAGGSTSERAQLEGLDLKPLFQGADKLDRDALYWHFPHNRMEVSYYMGSTVLEGDWKFYEGHGTIKDALFNLKDDPMEKNNVLTSNTEVADRLREKLNNWLEKVSAKMPKRSG